MRAHHRRQYICVDRASLATTSAYDGKGIKSLQSAPAAGRKLADGASIGLEPSQIRAAPGMMSTKVLTAGREESDLLEESVWGSREMH